MASSEHYNSVQCLLWRKSYTYPGVPSRPGHNHWAHRATGWQQPAEQSKAQSTAEGGYMGSHSSNLTNGNSTAEGASVMIRTRICSATPAPFPPLLVKDHSQRKAVHLQCAPGTLHLDCRSGLRAIEKEDSFIKNGGLQDFRIMSLSDHSLFV